MSKLLNIQSKRIVEYKCSNEFNYAQDIFHYLLDDIGVYYTTTNDDAPEYDESFEISKKDLKEAITKLEALKRGEDVKYLNSDKFSAYIDKDEFYEHLEQSGLTIQELIDLYKWMVENSAPNCEMVCVDWF